MKYHGERTIDVTFGLERRSVQDLCVHKLLIVWLGSAFLRKLSLTLGLGLGHLKVRTPWAANAWVFVGP